MKNFEKYRHNYICTCSGKQMYFLDLHTDMICIEDIAHSLSHICRFNGHSNTFYSIAEHSIMVSDLVDDKLKKYALLHDAGEAYICDISRPLKSLLNEASDNIYSKIEKDILHCINKKLGLSELNEDDKRAIKRADNTALYIESHYFFKSEMLVGWQYGEMLDTVLDIKIHAGIRNMDEVKKEFLKRYENYMRM